MNINDEIKRIIKEDRAEIFFNIFNNKIEKVTKLEQEEFDFLIDNEVMHNLLKLELYNRYEIYEMSRIAWDKVTDLIRIKKTYYKKHKMYEPELELLPEMYKELTNELTNNTDDKVLIDLIYRAKKIK